MLYFPLIKKLSEDVCEGTENSHMTPRPRDFPSAHKIPAILYIFKLIKPKLHILHRTQKGIYKKRRVPYAKFPNFWEPHKAKDDSGCHRMTLQVDSYLLKR